MLPARQRTMGFAMQSFFIGTGAIIASGLPWLLTHLFKVSTAANSHGIPHNVVLSFTIGGVVFFLAVLYTVLSTKEYPPDELAAFSEGEAENASHGIESEVSLAAGKIFRSALLWIFAGLVISALVYYFRMELEVYILGFGLIVFGVILLLTGWLTSMGKTSNGLVVVINDMFRMPGTMIRLAFVQFFTWFALFAMWIYTTAGVTSTKYDMKLDRPVFDSMKGTIENVSALPAAEQPAGLADVKNDMDLLAKKFDTGKKVVATMRLVQFFTDESKEAVLKTDPSVKERMNVIKAEYNKGADWVGMLMAVYNGFAAVMAFLLIGLARLTSRKTVHAISLLIGGLSLISFLFIKNPKLLMISELGIGLAWASILAMPYAILTGSLPAKKMGTYMGIFNFFIVIPQIMAASILGFMVKSLFGGESIYALVTGGVSMFIAALLVLFVHDNE